MKKTVTATVIMIFAMATLKGQEGNGTLLKVGDKAPLFTAKTIDGKTVDLTKIKDKVIMLTFFAT